MFLNSRLCCLSNKPIFQSCAVLGDGPAVLTASWGSRAGLRQKINNLPFLLFPRTFSSFALSPLLRTFHGYPAVLGCFDNFCAVNRFSVFSVFIFISCSTCKSCHPESTLGNHTHPSRLNVKATFRVNPFSNTSLEASLFLSFSLPLLLVVCLLQPFFLPCPQDNFCASSLLLLAWEPPEGGNVRIHRPIPYSKSEMDFFEYDVGNVHFREQIAFPQSVSLSFISDSRGADVAGRWKVCALSCI